MEVAMPEDAPPRRFAETVKVRITALVDHRHFVPYCLAVYLAIRLLLIFAIPVEQGSDAAWYFSRAQGLVNGQGYSERGVPTAYWPIGWPAALAFVFRLFGATALVGQFFNLALSGLSFHLVLRIARQAFASERAARLSVLFLALYPNNVGYVQTLMSEIFSTTLLLLGCYLYLRWEQRSFRNKFTMLLTGIVFGLLTLSKPQFFLFPSLLLLLSFIFAHGHELKRRIAVNAVVLYLVLIATVAPWSYRNYEKLGEFIFVSANGGLNLLIGNSPYATGDYVSFTDAQFPTVKFSSANQLNANRESSRLAQQWIKDNPLGVARLLPLKAWRLWGPDGEIEWLYQRGFRSYDSHVIAFRTVRLLNQIYYCAMLFLGLLVCPYYLYRNGEKLSAAGVLGFLVAAYLTGISLIMFGSARFHFPAMPFVIICCGYAVSRWINQPLPHMLHPHLVVTEPTSNDRGRNEFGTVDLPRETPITQRGQMENTAAGGAS